MIDLLGAVFNFKIHIGLFFTLILSDMSWIFTALIQVKIITIWIQSLIQSDAYQSVIQIWCASQIVLDTSILQPFSHSKVGFPYGGGRVDPPYGKPMIDTINANANLVHFLLNFYVVISYHKI